MGIISVNVSKIYLLYYTAIYKHNMAWTWIFISSLTWNTLFWFSEYLEIDSLTSKISILDWQRNSLDNDAVVH